MVVRKSVRERRSPSLSSPWTGRGNVLRTPAECLAAALQPGQDFVTVRLPWERGLDSARCVAGSLATPSYLPIIRRVLPSLGRSSISSRPPLAGPIGARAASRGASRISPAERAYERENRQRKTAETLNDTLLATDLVIRVFFGVSGELAAGSPQLSLEGVANLLRRF